MLVFAVFPQWLQSFRRQILPISSKISHVRKQWNDSRGAPEIPRYAQQVQVVAISVLYRTAFVLLLVLGRCPFPDRWLLKEWRRMHSQEGHQRLLGWGRWYVHSWNNSGIIGFLRLLYILKKRKNYCTTDRRRTMECNSGQQSSRSFSKGPTKGFVIVGHLHPSA